jgi:uncharacterized protein YcfJ
MPSSHHRKKHKHFQPPSHQQAKPKNRASAAIVMAIVGGVVGLAITYLAAQESPAWVVAGTIAGIAIGYYGGKQLDRAGEKK